MSDQSEKLDPGNRLGEELIATFKSYMAEAERVRAIVAPLNTSIPAFLKTREVFLNRPLTMLEVIDFTVQLLLSERDIIGICLAQKITMSDVIEQIAGDLWLHYQMKDYAYLNIDKSPAFTCSREIQDALTTKLQAVGLVELSN